MKIAKVKMLMLYCLAWFVIGSSEAGTNLQQLQNDLNSAAYYGHADTVRRMIVENPSLDLDASLIQALNGNHDDIARWLLQNGADPNGGKIPGKHVYTAARNHNKTMLDYLIVQGASIDAERENDTTLISTPLNQAIFDGDVEAVRLLLDAGADVNRISAGGYTPLLQATWRDGEHRLDLVRLLLVRGADPDFEGATGISPRLAAETAELDDVSSLIEGYKPKPAPRKLPVSQFSYTLDDLTADEVARLLHWNQDRLQGFSADEGFYLVGMTSEPERIRCHSMKRYMNGFPVSDVDVMAGICGQGPFDSNNIDKTVKLSVAAMKILYKPKEASAEQRRFFESMVTREIAVTDTEESYSFVMTGIGEGGVGFFPTGVITDSATATSLVVQFIDSEETQMDTGKVESFTRELYQYVRHGIGSHE